MTTLVWGTLIERNAFALRRVELPVLNAGSWPVRVLHISDLHLLPRQRRKASWVRALADLRPDLVVNTGDTLAGVSAVPAAVAALDPLLDLPGAFVFGNNDFNAPVPKSPHRYSLRSTRLTSVVQSCRGRTLAQRPRPNAWLAST